MLDPDLTFGNGFMNRVVPESSVPAIRLQVTRVESRNAVEAIIENTPGDASANSYLRDEISQPVDLHLAIRRGNHLCLHCRLGYYTLLLRLPNDEGSEGLDEDSQGGLARVCFSPQVCIGVP